MYLQDTKTRKWSVRGTVIERRAHDRSYYVRVDRTGRVYLRNRVFLKPSKYPQGQTYTNGFGGDDGLHNIDMTISAADADNRDNDTRYAFIDNTYHGGIRLPGRGE